MSSEVSNSETNEPLPSSAPRPSLRRRIWRVSFRSSATIVGLLLFYLLCALIGLIPVNNQFREPETGQTIYVYSGEVHSDLILPVVSEIVDWRDHFTASDYKSSIAYSSHVSIGWGDRGFYLETPTWSDFKLSVAAKAMLLPSRTVLHVRYQGKPRELDNQRKVVITDEQYRRLVDYILASAKKESDNNDSNEPMAGNKLFSKPKRIACDTYGPRSSFYEATGTYHAFNTCNCWAGNGLKQAGVRVPCFSPFPKAILRYLPED